MELHPVDFDHTYFKAETDEEIHIKLLEDYQELMGAVGN